MNGIMKGWYITLVITALAAYFLSQSGMDDTTCAILQCIVLGIATIYAIQKWYKKRQNQKIQAQKQRIEAQRQRERERELNRIEAENKQRDQVVEKKILEQLQSTIYKSKYEQLEQRIQEKLEQGLQGMGQFLKFGYRPDAPTYYRGEVAGSIADNLAVMANSVKKQEYDRQMAEYNAAQRTRIHGHNQATSSFRYAKTLVQELQKLLIQANIDQESREWKCSRKMKQCEDFELYLQAIMKSIV